MGFDFLYCSGRTDKSKLLQQTTAPKLFLIDMEVQLIVSVDSTETLLKCQICGRFYLQGNRNDSNDIVLRSSYWKEVYEIINVGFILSNIEFNDKSMDYLKVGGKFRVGSKNCYSLGKLVNLLFLC